MFTNERAWKKLGCRTRSLSRSLEKAIKLSYFSLTSSFVRSLARLAKYLLGAAAAGWRLATGASGAKNGRKKATNQLLPLLSQLARAQYYFCP